MTHIHVNSTSLLGIDQHATVLLGFAAANTHSRAYCAYGSHPLAGGEEVKPGFNGNVPDAVTGWYLLGNGYRPYNPTLMRFVSPDDMSPFGLGGLNGYGYCGGDPVNMEDPSGHFGFFRSLFRPLRRVARFVGLTGKRTAPATASSPSTKPPSKVQGVDALTGTSPTGLSYWSPKALPIEFPEAPYPPTLLGRRNAIRPITEPAASGGGIMQSPNFDLYHPLARSRVRNLSISSERVSPLPITPWDGTRDYRQPSAITRKFKQYVPQVPAPRAYPIEQRSPMPLPSDIRNP